MPSSDPPAFICPLPSALCDLAHPSGKSGSRIFGSFGDIRVGATTRISAGHRLDDGIPVVELSAFATGAGPTTSRNFATSGRSTFTITLVDPDDNDGTDTGTIVGLTSITDGPGTVTGTTRTGAPVP